MLKTERYSIRIFKANNSITIANVSSIWSYFAQKEFELSGIFPEASFENMRIICNKKSVCEDHIANCIQINTIRHPSDTIVPEDFNQIGRAHV